MADVEEGSTRRTTRRGSTSRTAGSTRKRPRAVRVQRGTACLRCSQGKRKCDGGRPCGRCKRLGKPCLDHPDHASETPPQSAVAFPPAKLVATEGGSRPSGVAATASSGSLPQLPAGAVPLSARVPTESGEKMLQFFYDLVAEVTDPADSCDSSWQGGGGHSEGARNPRAGSASTGSVGSGAGFADPGALQKAIVPTVQPPSGPGALALWDVEDEDVHDDGGVVADHLSALVTAVTGGVTATSSGFAGRFNAGYFAVNAKRHGVDPGVMAQRLLSMLRNLPSGQDQAMRNATLSMLTKALGSKGGALPIRLLASSHPELAALSKSWLAAVQGPLLRSNPTLTRTASGLPSEMAFDGVHLTMAGLARAALAFWAEDVTDAPLPSHPRILMAARETHSAPSDMTGGGRSNPWADPDWDSDSDTELADVGLGAASGRGVPLSALLSKFTHLPALLRPVKGAARTRVGTWLAAVQAGIDAVPPMELVSAYRGHLAALPVPAVTYLFEDALPGATNVAANYRLHTVFGVTPFMLRCSLRLGTTAGLKAGPRTAAPPLWVHPDSRTQRSVAHRSAANLGLDSFTFEGLFTRVEQGSLPEMTGRWVTVDSSATAVPMYGVETTHVERYPSGAVMARTCYISDLMTTPARQHLWDTLATPPREATGDVGDVGEALMQRQADVPVHAPEGAARAPPSARWRITSLGNPPEAELARITTHAVASEFEEHLQPSFGCGNWLLARMACWKQACNAEKRLLQPKNLLKAVRRRAAETLLSCQPHLLTVSVGHETTTSSLAPALFRHNFMFEVTPPEGTVDPNAQTILHMRALRRNAVEESAGRLGAQAAHKWDAVGEEGSDASVASSLQGQANAAEHTEKDQPIVGPSPPPTGRLPGSLLYTLTWTDPAYPWDERHEWARTVGGDAEAMACS